MSEIREIVTKAVVSKGKKTIRLNTSVPLDGCANKILGCNVTNNVISGTLDGNKVLLDGSFELNVWYEVNNTTNISKSNINYCDKIKIREIIPCINNDDLVICTTLTQNPTCTNALISDDEIKVDVVFEILAEVIGETKMMVSTFNCNETVDQFDDFENEINEDFLNEES